MKSESKLIIFAAAAVVIVVFAAWQTAVGLFECESLEDRQRRLGMIKSGAVIVDEARIDGNIVCAVKYEGEKGGLAVFEPLENGRHKLRGSYWRDEKEIATAFAVAAGQKYYNVFSLLRDDLDYAEVKYSYPDGTVREFTLDMEPGRMIAYCREPDAGSYSISIAFYDINGNRYE